MVKDQYFEFNGKVMSWEDTMLVTEAFIAFLDEMGLLSEFRDDLQREKSITIEEHVEFTIPGLRDDMVNAFSWQGTYTGHSAYSSLRDSWMVIMRRLVPAVTYTAFKENGKLINEIRTKPR